MNVVIRFRSFGLVMLALSTWIVARGESFEEPTYIDFKARGYTHYDIFIAASSWSPYFSPYSLATAYVSFGGSPLSASSTDYNGADASLRINGIHPLNDQEWIADTVEASDSNFGWRSDRTSYDVVMPSAGVAIGEGRADGFIVPLWGTVTEW